MQDWSYGHFVSSGKLMGESEMAASDAMDPVVEQLYLMDFGEADGGDRGRQHCIFRKYRKNVYNKWKYYHRPFHVKRYFIVKTRN